MDGTDDELKRQIALSPERVLGRLAVEEPANLTFAIFDGDCSVGAFSIVTCDADIRATDIGRYASVGKQTIINPCEHPYDFLSQSGLAVHGSGACIGMSGFPEASAIGATAVSRAITHKPERSTIGHDAYVGHRTIVLQGVNIGIGAIVGAGSVVTKDVPDFAIVAGNPARFVRWRFDEETRARILASRWWEYDLSHIPHRDYSDIHGLLDQIERIQRRSWSPTS